MTQTAIQKAFAPLKRILPKPISNAIRSTVTAFFTPIHWSIRSGHFKSSFLMKAVSKKGQPIPWYTYPCIDFLSHQHFTDCTVLEFGAGQSTFWWSKIAKNVVSFEGDEAWYEELQNKIPDNVSLHHVSLQDRATCVREINAILEQQLIQAFDVVIIDGLYRYEMIPIALQYRKQEGALICDNAEGYGFYEGLSSSGLQRVDFYGNAPGVVLAHATSIFFADACFLFANSEPIARVAKE